MNTWETSLDIFRMRLTSGAPSSPFWPDLFCGEILSGRLQHFSGLIKLPGGSRQIEEEGEGLKISVYFPNSINRVAGRSFSVLKAAPSHGTCWTCGVSQGVGLGHPARQRPWPCWAPPLLQRGTRNGARLTQSWRFSKWSSGPDRGVRNERGVFIYKMREKETKLQTAGCVPGAARSSWTWSLHPAHTHSGRLAGLSPGQGTFADWPTLGLSGPLALFLGWNVAGWALARVSYGSRFWGLARKCMQAVP